MKTRFDHLIKKPVGRFDHLIKKPVGRFDHLIKKPVQDTLVDSTPISADAIAKPKPIDKPKQIDRGYDWKYAPEYEMNTGERGFFPAPEGDEFQYKDYHTPEPEPKPKPKPKKPNAFGEALDHIADGFQPKAEDAGILDTGLSMAASGVKSTGELIGKTIQAPGELQKLVYDVLLNSFKNKIDPAAMVQLQKLRETQPDNDAMGKAGRDIEKLSNIATPFIVKTNPSVTDAISKGNYKEAGIHFLNGVADVVPQLATFYFGGPLAGFGAIGGSTLTDVAKENANDDTMSPEAKLGTATGKALAEAIPELFGLERAAKVFRSLSKPAKELFKKGLAQAAKTIGKEATMQSASEILGENTTNVLNNVIDVFNDKKGWDQLFDNWEDTTVMAGGIGAITGAASGAGKYKHGTNPNAVDPNVVEPAAQERWANDTNQDPNTYDKRYVQEQMQSMVEDPYSIIKNTNDKLAAESTFSEFHDGIEDIKNPTLSDKYNILTQSSPKVMEAAQEEFDNHRPYSNPFIKPGINMNALNMSAGELYLVEALAIIAPSQEARARDAFDEAKRKNMISNDIGFEQAVSIANKIVTEGIESSNYIDMIDSALNEIDEEAYKELPRRYKKLYNRIERIKDNDYKNDNGSIRSVGYLRGVVNDIGAFPKSNIVEKVADKLTEEYKAQEDNRKDTKAYQRRVEKVRDGKTRGATLIQRALFTKDKAILSTEDIISVTEDIDGGKPGVTQKLFFDDLSKAYNNALARYYSSIDRIRKAFGQKKKNKYDISLNKTSKLELKLAESFDVRDDLTITNDDALNIYLVSLNSRIDHEALQYDGVFFKSQNDLLGSEPTKLSKEDINEIKNHIDNNDELKALKESIIREVDKQFDNASFIYRKLNGKAPSKETFLAARRAGASSNIQDTTPTLRRSTLTTREQENTGPIQLVGAYNKALDDIKALTSYEAMETDIKIANKFLEDNGESIANTYGKMYRDYLQQYLHDLTASSNRDNGLLIKFLQWYRHKSTQRSFVANVGVGMTQPVSMINALVSKHGISTKNAMRGVFNVLSSLPTIEAKWTDQYTGLASIRERIQAGPIREMQEFTAIMERNKDIRRGYKGTAKKGAAAAANAYDNTMSSLLYLIKFMDKLTVLAIAEASEMDYIDNINKKDGRKIKTLNQLTLEDKIQINQKAQKAISATQIASRKMDRSAIRRSDNELYKQITMYSGAIYKAYNVANQLFQEAKNAKLGSAEQIKATAKLVFLLGASTGGIGTARFLGDEFNTLISNLVFGPDEDDEETNKEKAKKIFKSSAVETTTSYINPAFGRLATPISTKIKYNRYYDPSIPIESDIGMVSDFGKAMMEEEDEAKMKNLRKGALKATSLIFGLPLNKWIKQKSDSGTRILLPTD